MSSSEAPRVGIIGFGEVGSALGRGLRSEGLPGVVAADAAVDDATFGPLIRRRAAEATVELLPSNAEVAEVSDVILVAVPGWRALAAAEAAAPGLRKGQLYVDVGSASPRVKQALAEAVERAGARRGPRQAAARRTCRCQSHDVDCGVVDGEERCAGARCSTRESSPPRLRAPPRTPRPKIVAR
jgi:hypothetical protein